MPLLFKVKCTYLKTSALREIKALYLFFIFFQYSPSFLVLKVSYNWISWSELSFTWSSFGRQHFSIQGFRQNSKHQHQKKSVVEIMYWFINLHVCICIYIYTRVSNDNQPQKDIWWEDISPLVLSVLPLPTC